MKSSTGVNFDILANKDVQISDYKYDTLPLPVHRSEVQQEPRIPPEYMTADRTACTPVRNWAPARLPVGSSADMRAYRLGRRSENRLVDLGKKEFRYT